MSVSGTTTWRLAWKRGRGQKWTLRYKWAGQAHIKEADADG